MLDLKIIAPHKHFEPSFALSPFKIYGNYVGTVCMIRIRNYYYYYYFIHILIQIYKYFFLK